MALLQSLQICGIRNFSPEEQHTITFSTPVVLFQGPNGSGKTTILESIKFALTGELPAGTDSGKGFVNEPKMMNKNQTKAAIKIKFTDPQGNKILCSKVLQVTVVPKSGKLSFKRVAPTIRKYLKDDPDIPVDISGRCIDIESYCCTSLNVSKSIFNNVLFCHQENSFWPLDEPKSLKEKFDEIFDAVRYKKCVEHIRNYIKETQGKVKIFEERLKSRTADKDRAIELRNKVDEKKQKLSEVKELILEKNSEVRPIEDRIKEIIELEAKLGSLQSNLSSKEAQKKGLQEQQETIKESIGFVYEGSDEELNSMINSFNQKQKNEEMAIKQLEKDVQTLNKELVTINNAIQKQQIKIGQMKEEQNQYRNKIKESKELMDKLREKLNIDNFEDKEMLIEEMSKAIKLKEENLAILKSKNNEEEKILQDNIDKLRESSAGIKQSIESKTISVNDLKNKLKNNRYKLEELNTSNSQLQSIQSKIENLQSNLKNIQNSFNENEKLRDIENFKEELTQKERHMEKLEKEQRILLRNYATEENIEYEKKSITEKQGEIEKIKVKHAENFKELFNNEIPFDNLKSSVVDIQNEQDDELYQKNKDLNELEKELSNLQTTLKIQKKKLNEFERELLCNKRKIAKVCDGNKTFFEVLEETAQSKEKYQRLKGNYSVIQIIYEKFINDIGASKCCPVCSTKFDKNETAVPEIIKTLKAKIQSTPAELAKTEKILKKTENDYNKLQQLKSVNDQIEVMENKKIPELKAEISTLTETIEEKTMLLADQQISIIKPKKLVKICHSVMADVSLLSEHQLSITRAESKITELEKKIETVPSNRTRQETEMEIDSLKAEISNLKNRYENTKTMLEQHRERCQNLTKSIQEETQKQINYHKLVQEIPLLEKQEIDYKENIACQTMDIEEARTKLKQIERDLKEAIENKNKSVNLNSQNLDKMNKIILNLQNIFTDIQKLEVKIKEYETKGSETMLHSSVHSLAELQEALETMEKKRSDHQTEISEKKESLARNENKYRELKDNVTLRERRKQETLVDDEIKQLKDKIGGYNYRKIYEEKQQKQQKISKLQQEINILIGQQDEIQTQHDDDETELRKPVYKNAVTEYKKQYYEVFINKRISEDLTNYVVVLERCILKFHEERMVQINQLIKNLWRTIYRGNDIDYIEIKADEPSVGATKRRNYNSRVVQVKNGKEIDMRGRCSAGQKVLACLVIRMALAETFSANCGLLALDEPTTNLDKANISSLSDALSNLINSRSQQDNFQLLVITHDEEFIRSLSVDQSIDSYWHVSRNAAGNSTVEKKML